MPPGLRRLQGARRQGQVAGGHVRVSLSGNEPHRRGATCRSACRPLDASCHEVPGRTSPMLAASRPLLVRCLALLALLGGRAAAPATTSSASALTAADACGTLVARSTGGYWTCSFADDFSGKDLDTTKWVVQNTA